MKRNCRVIILPWKGDDDDGDAGDGDGDHNDDGDGDPDHNDDDDEKE